MEPIEQDLRGLDGERPLPAALRTRLEVALLEAATAGAGGAGADETARLIAGVDQPRPLPITTRKALQQALVRRRGRRAWHLPLAAAAVLLFLVASVAALRGERSRDDTVAAGRRPSPPSITEPVPEATGPPGAVAPARAPAPTPPRSTATSATAACPAGCRAPSDAAAGSQAAAPSAASAANGPYVSSVDPNSGPMSGGTMVTVRGGGFTGADGVLFGSAPAVSFTVVSDTEIRAVSPPSSQPDTVVVSATFPDGGASRAGPGARFSYTAPVP